MPASSNAARTTSTTMERKSRSETRQGGVSAMPTMLTSKFVLACHLSGPSSCHGDLRDCLSRYLQRQRPLKQLLQNEYSFSLPGLSTPSLGTPRILWAQ